MRKFGLTLVALVFMALLVPAAKADLISNLTFDSCTGNCGPQASFGTVTVHNLDSTTVSITVTLLNGNEFVTTGTHTGFAFNVSKPATVDTATLPLHWSAVTSITEPALGDFSNGVNCDQGNSNSKSGCAGSNPFVGTLTFHVLGVQESDFISNGSYYFAADILSGTTGKTGLVGAPGVTVTTQVPEPASLMLLGSGLSAAALRLRKRKK